MRFVIQVEDQLAGTVGAQHPYAHDRGIVETFYFVLPGFRRRGLASAGLRLVDEWVRRVTPELRRLQLHVVVGNPGSARVAELAGYRFEGVAVHQTRQLTDTVLAMRRCMASPSSVAASQASAGSWPTLGKDIIGNRQGSYAASLLVPAGSNEAIELISSNL